MGKADIHLVDETDEIEHQFRSLMRRLAGGVAVITAGRGDEITGMTVTSLTSLSAAPPRVLVSINRQASSFALIERYRSFGVNILGSEQQTLADRFSNGRLKGRQRFEGAVQLVGAALQLVAPQLGGDRRVQVLLAHQAQQLRALTVRSLPGTAGSCA